ncbi:MAG TPA: DUF1194 domain-containing protein [Beijerinckiaceae bacterium]|nr:DUF1194 domain-containing protein [Beijerinckiaceae bacterium]
MTAGFARVLRVLACFMTCLWACSLTTSVRASPEEVDVALVLAVDVSYSMDLEEQRLQREGYIAALNSPDVQRAIRMGMVGRIAITYVEWANAFDQTIVLPWTILDGPDSTRAATDRIAATPPRRAQRTSISGALTFSHKLLQDMPYRALRRIIDVSGDGPNNAGSAVERARDAVLADGITINGLPVMVKRNLAGWGDIDHLDAYYQDCVIGGPGAFVIGIRSMEEFLPATRQKIIREIASLGMADISPVQQRETKSDCMIGERMVRDRWGN